MIRMFICVELGEELRSKIASQLSVLRSIGTGIKWVDQRNLHITLKFLGDVSKDRVDTVVKAVELSVRDSRVFAMDFAGIGAFPSMTDPSVLWIGVTRGREKFSALASTIDAELSREGFPCDRRSAMPHLTIGRVKSFEKAAELNNVVPKLQQARFGEMKVDTITVMESRLYKSGPVYSPLKRVFIGP